MQRIKRAPSQLASVVAKELLYEMTEGKYRDADRLPPEVKIAEESGISRTAIRDGMSILEREGWITRIWGHGTIINRHILSAGNRLDLETEFLEKVRYCGYEPEITNVSVSYGKASEKIASKLDLAVGEPVISVCRTILASGTPAIFCEDTFGERIIKKDYSEEDLAMPIFSFFRDFCDEEVFLELTEIHAVNAAGRVAEELNLAPGTAVQNLDEIGFGRQGKPIMRSDEYYVEGIISHSVIRKKI